jgi:predicted RNase H-like nuclease
MKQVYRITYPTKKIYIGKDSIGSYGYFGSPDMDIVNEDFAALSAEERNDYTIRKEILWESPDCTESKLSAMEVYFIEKLQSNNPVIGYNRWAKFKQARTATELGSDQQAPHGILLAGVDLAWQSEKNPSSIAYGALNELVLTVNHVEPAIYGIDEVLNQLTSFVGLQGIAIDAPLIINNSGGQRLCENEIGREYGSRHAACHTSNTKLYPDAKSVYLSNNLELKGFNHLKGDRWQIECYPHPAIIEIFGLKERLKYKKGKVAEKKAGQKALAQMILSLKDSNILQLMIKGDVSNYLDDAYIDSLVGQGLKSNEDALDAIVCLYIAGLYSLKQNGQVFGNSDAGYIWVPQKICL